jgi:hypothetical protein
MFWNVVLKSIGHYFLSFFFGVEYLFLGIHHWFRGWWNIVEKDRYRSTLGLANQIKG